MRAIFNDNKSIYFDNITTNEEDVLWNELSVESPNTFVDSSDSMWDGVYRKYNRSKRKIARPLFSILRGICKKYNFPLDIVDNRGKPEYSPISHEDVDENFLPGITLDEHQVRSIKQACRIECGIFSIPTGGGKGEIICGVCKAIDCPTVIIAEEKIVIDQLKSRLELREIKSDIGLFYAGKRPSGQSIVVGSIQSLQTPPPIKDIDSRAIGETKESYEKRLKKWESSLKAYKTRLKNARYLQKYIKAADMVIVDECDKATSDPYKKLFRHWFSGRRRYGFSGTPFDPEKPVEALVMQEHLGSVIAKESRRKLVEIGRIISCDYMMLGIGPFSGNNESSAYDIARDEHIVNSPSFHMLIAKTAKKYKGDGTLVLVDREILGYALVAAMAKVGLTAHYIFGKTPKKRRDEHLRAFERREFDVLIGGKIINRGLDLSGGCENLIVATGGKLQSEFEQKIGRALRRNKNGKSRVIDFFFRCNKYLYKHSKARLQIMVNNEYDTKVIFPGGSFTGEELIKRRFQIPKKYFIPNRQKKLFDK